MDKNLAGALLKAQALMGKLIPDSNNLGFKSKYASLAAVLDTVRGPLSEAGLVLYQSVSSADGMVVVSTKLIHAESGEAIEEYLALPVAQQTPQAYGSAITYARRYMAMAMCGIAPDDDDGEAGSATQYRQTTTKVDKRLAATAPKVDLDELGKEVYGDQWPTVKAHNVQRLADGKELTPEQVQKMIAGLQKLKAQRSKQPA